MITDIANSTWVVTKIPANDPLKPHQWKFRDEVPSPFGVMPRREFLIRRFKSFDWTKEKRATPITAIVPSLRSYERMACKRPSAPIPVSDRGDDTHRVLVLRETGRIRGVITADHRAESRRELDYDPSTKFSRDGGVTSRNRPPRTDENHATGALPNAAERPAQRAAGSKGQNLISHKHIPNRWRDRARGRRQKPCGSHGARMAAAAAGANHRCPRRQKGIIWPEGVTPSRRHR